ncbi:uncharacterized protein LOC131939948 [Physella acuta]|uniref:uncharacterized protein LOC131939948 n=1 Tax=Physella acuta TaxID=109671 RepID=UPI0027DE332B|nr:uncharacterized protein LOC131939948 [Physella acuta]
MCDESKNQKPATEEYEAETDRDVLCHIVYPTGEEVTKPVDACDTALKLKKFYLNGQPSDYDVVLELKDDTYVMKADSEQLGDNLHKIVKIHIVQKGQIIPEKNLGVCYKRN